MAAAVALTLICTFGYAQNATATPSVAAGEAPASAPPPLGRQVVGTADPMDSLDRWRRMLAEERAVLERQADRQFASLEKLAERGIWVGGIFLTAALAWIVWFFGKTKSETRTTLKEMFEQQAKQVLDSEAALVREQYQALREEVEELASYKSRTVVWVAGAAALAENELLLPAIDRVISVLQGAGINKISRMEPSQGMAFDIGDPDLVVLSFDGTEESRVLLQALVERLKIKAPPVPLLIYTHIPGRPQVKLEDADIEMLDDFDWYVPVNFPAQLVAQVQVLLRRSRSLLTSESHYG
jgi:hypothetical protein